MEATCATCPFFQRHSGTTAPTGNCRARNPMEFAPHFGDGSYVRAYFPVVNDAEWCGEHPLRQRDRLAAMAMQGSLTAPDCVVIPKKLAQFAYEIADAMLAEAARSPGKGEPTP